MSLTKIIPLVESLPLAEKFQLMQILLTYLACEKGFSLHVQDKPKIKQGQRMADRGALSHISEPTAWQREIRKDRPLPSRE
jgi:hypothetical protein